MATVSKYQEEATQVFDKYMQLYLDAYPDEKNPATALAFLRLHNDKYREEINNIALLSFRNNEYDKAVHDQIHLLNDENTVRLHEKITAISVESKNREIL